MYYARGMSFRAWLVCALALALSACPTTPPTPANDAATPEVDAAPPPHDSGPPDDAWVMPPPGTYENVTRIFTASCNFSSCHGGAGAGAAMLNLQRSMTAGTLVADLVAHPACEYDAMPLVDPGHPENSWLYLKTTGPHTGTTVDFTPDASWDHGGLTPNASGNYPASTCPLTASGDIIFGDMMPQGTMGVTALQAETLRMWIADGAPGPI